MSYIILSAIVIIFSYVYELLKNTGRLSRGARVLFCGVICFALCLFAGLRTDYNDTSTYIYDFEHTTSDFASILAGKFSLSRVYLFKIWQYVIYHYISSSPIVFLFLSAMVFVCPSISLIDKYSKNFTLSIILFMFGGMYLFSLAGLKQAMATGVIMMGLPKLFEKKYFTYYLFCILSLGFHAYSIFFLILPLLGSEVFNKRTIIFCISVVVVGALLSLFSSAITTIIDFLGKDVEEETLLSGSVNMLRALVFMVPLALTIIGRKNLSIATSYEKWLLKIGVLSSIFMVLALFGNPILFGRIPQYFLIGIVVTLPLLISKAFSKRDQLLILFIAVLCYIIFGVYSLYIDGAFVEDIFRLTWF
ncbi:MAG: EpsG family protein [Clostridia bacterium]|nr:EpsG family protein [Clostridia bacterium]